MPTCSDDISVQCRRVYAFNSSCAAGSEEDETAVKEATSATLRCFPFDQPASVGNCFYTGGDATEVAIFAKAY